MQQKAKALYFFVGTSSFVEKDELIFSEIFHLRKFNFQINKKIYIFIEFVRQLFFILKNLRGTSFLIVQLAGYHSFLPVLIAQITGKKSLIIAAGTDCHSFPSIGYGNYQKTFLSLFTKLSFRLCSHISPKHESLWFCQYNYSDKDFTSQGIKYFNPGIKKKYTVIENGYLSGKFLRQSEFIRGSFITIAGGLQFRFQKQLKGIDLIIEAAKQFPNNNFTIVGAKNYFSKEETPENVKLLPVMPNSELAKELSRHQYYLQLSMAEGFPNALCEAMLCECIPVGSDVFSIPEIIGDTGYILKHRSSDELKILLEKILEESEKMNGFAARERIIKNYPLEKRKQKLIRLFKDF